MGLAEMRNSSSWWHCASAGGKCASWLPASISFCNCRHWPISVGRVVMWLSVNISQRSRCGRAAAGTSLIWQDLKPTISNCAHWPSTVGSAVNGLPEQKITRKRCSLCRSSGRVLRALPERLSTSSVSARSKISDGNVVRPSDRSSRRMPCSWPERSWERVCMAGIVHTPKRCHPLAGG